MLLGAWSITGSHLAVESLGRSGVDYVCLDQQHGDVRADHTGELLRSLPGTSAALVRVPGRSAHLIEHALDQGAEGVIVPLVENAQHATDFASVCRFPPVGIRSYGGRTRGIARFDGDPQAANLDVMVIAMVESVAAVAAIEAICATPGLDAIYIGLSDLALSLGLAPGMTVRPGPHAEAVQHIARAAKRAGVAWGTHESAGADRDDLVRQGAQLVTICTDALLVEAGARSAVAQGRTA